MQNKHTPVLLAQVLEAFEPISLRIFFEGTVGAGGHSREILRSHPEIEMYFACDRDPSALEIAKNNLAQWSDKVRWIQGPFSKMNTYLQADQVSSIDGFLIDIGVSSMQFDQAGRGFSFREDAPLDMRMDPNTEITAADLVNQLPEKELARIFYEYGEEFRSRAAAQAITIARKKKRIESTHELVRILEPVLRKGKIHFATKVFQALRIEVNQELEELKEGLRSAIQALAPGGRMAVISFHSLEDRIVKWCFREDQRLNVVTKKPLSATREEIRQNPRARSAKLRVAEKIGEK